MFILAKKNSQKVFFFSKIDKNRKLSVTISVKLGYTFSQGIEVYKKKFRNFLFKIATIYDDGWEASGFEALCGWRHNCSNSYCKNFFLLTINKSKETSIRFKKYWILINLCKFEVQVRIFYKKNGQKLSISWKILTI